MLGYSVCGWAGDTVCVPSSIPPAAPSPPGFGEEVVGCSNLTSLLAKWFCAWMRERGEEWCWLETSVCCVKCSPFLLPKVQISRAWNWASDKTVQALVVLWMSIGSGRAGQGLRCHPSVALKRVCLPRHWQMVFLGSWRVIQRRWEELCCGRSSATSFCRQSVLRFPVPKMCFL